MKYKYNYNYGRFNFKNLILYVSQYSVFNDYEFRNIYLDIYPDDLIVFKADQVQYNYLTNGRFVDDLPEKLRPEFAEMKRRWPWSSREPYISGAYRLAEAKPIVMKITGKITIIESNLELGYSKY